MPGLLDLPPELVEHIFLFKESVQRVRQAYEDEDGTEYVITAPLFRLTNRYIEQCTRRLFAKSFFKIRRIVMPQHASIKAFCDMASYPELVKYMNGLHFTVTNDQHERLEISSVTRNEIVDALRAFPATCELVFSDAPRKDEDGLHREDRTAGTMTTFDMSSSFSFVLSVAEEAGMRPEWISTWSCESPLFGLTDCFAIAERNRVMSEVELLNIAIVPPRPEDGVTLADV